MAARDAPYCNINPLSIGDCAELSKVWRPSRGSPCSSC